MSEKIHIVASLGEQKLVLPGLVNAALAANDRVKYFFALIQAARSHADHPESPVPDLRQERVAAGVRDSRWDEVAPAAVKLGDGRYRIPGAGDMVRNMDHEVELMLRPLADRDGFMRRAQSLHQEWPGTEDDSITAREIDRLTAGTAEAGDSVHLLVMDAHKALNALQREIAAETVEGAAVYDIGPGDRGLIGAFMRGVQRTAPLKLDHPGLGTTATRAGDQLVLQNDIGTTDAHVIVIHVRDLQVELTYTDVHLARLLFFQRLLRRFAVRWKDMVSRREDALEGGMFHMSVGTFSASAGPELDAYLEFLGSRLVFLIDWNRARKRLKALVPSATALALLDWAADQDYGHMAFLKAGGEQLVYDALDFAMRGEARYGERLHDLLGAESATDYLRFVLKTCAQSSSRGEPESFIQDTVRAELLACLRSGKQRLFEIAGEHAAFLVEIAGAVRDSAMQLRARGNGAQVARNAARAKAWESRADDQVNRARSAPRQYGSGDGLAGIVAAADDAADELEEAAFRLTLMSASGVEGSGVDLAPLATLLVQAAQEYVKVVESARLVRRGAREDMQDFLDSVHQVMALEHRIDAAQREVGALLVRQAADFRSMYVLGEATKNLERAADALMHSSLGMKDFALGEVTAT